MKGTFENFLAVLKQYWEHSRQYLLLRQMFILICDQQSNSSSCVVRRPLCLVVLCTVIITLRFTGDQYWRKQIYIITDKLKVMDRARNPFQALMNNNDTFKCDVLKTSCKSDLSAFVKH